MTIYVFPADETGCGLHRLIWPAMTLRGRGEAIKVIEPKMKNLMLEAHVSKDGKILDVNIPQDATVIALQRVTHRLLVEAIPVIRAKGVAVTIDMDDNLSSIHPKNPAFKMLHPVHGLGKDHNWNFAQQACENATYVTVSTPALMKQYVRHGRGQVLYNCIPERYIRMEHVDSATIGWAGSLHSHPDDFDALGNTINILEPETGPFHVMGPGDGIREALGLRHPVVATGPLDPLDTWPEGISKLGIGVTPLADTLFNAGKSWLKPLEMAALGVPCVMSPRVEYTRIHQEGVGILAAKPKHWLSHLRRLVANPSERVELSERGREVAARWTVEGNAWRWLEAWDNAKKHI